MISKQVKILRYCCYFICVAIALITYVFAPIEGNRIVDGDPNFYLGQIQWTAVIFVIGAMVIYGIYIITEIFRSIEAGNIFTMENAEKLKKVDKLIIWALCVSLAANLYFAIVGPHHPGFVIMWLAFIIFLVLCHLVIKPLYMIVLKSAEMKLELDLVV